MFHAKGFHGMMLFLTIVAAALAALLFTASGTAACAQEEGVRLPIVMYHDLTNNPLDQDDYTLSLEQLEQDLVAFEEHGFTPVPLSAVLHYVLDGSELPGKPVLLVFDDGYRSFFTGALPLLQKHQVPAVVSVIGRQAEEASHETCASFMSWAELNQAVDCGLVELISHSADLHVYCRRSGLARLSCESEEEYKRVVLEDLKKMADLCEAAGVELQPAFAYPYGSLEPLAEPLLKQQGMLATLTSEEHVNRLTRDAECLYLMGRLNRSGFLTTEEVLHWMERQD